MKRKLVILVLLISTSFAFSKNFFQQRFVELKIDVPVTVSNNAMSIFDFMQKEVVIDLRKIADNLPAGGFNSMLLFSPNIELNINLPKICHLGFETGINGYGTLNMTKGIFDFLGYGNGLYDSQLFSSDLNGDMFAYLNASFDVKIKKLSIGIIPNLYVPLFHLETESCYSEIANDEDGNLSFKMDVTENVFSFMSWDDKDNLKSKDLQEKILKSLGFDLEGFLGYELTDKLGLTLNYRVPIIPGRLYYCTPQKITSGFNTKVMDLLSSGVPSIAFERTSSEATNVIYYLNRPLKASLDANFKPMGNFLTLNAKGGVGIRNPFMPDMKFYPEYLAGVKISLAGLVTAQLLTEYTEQLFKHTLAVSATCRIVQLDLGFSLASNDFLKSFQGTGAGLFVTVTMGF